MDLLVGLDNEEEFEEEEKEESEDEDISLLFKKDDEKCKLLNLKYL